jgi:hypothetical protein
MRGERNKPCNEIKTEKETAKLTQKTWWFVCLSIHLHANQLQLHFGPRKIFRMPQDEKKKLADMLRC